MTRAQSAGRPTVVTRGEGTGGRAGRGGRNARPTRRVNAEPVVEPVEEPVVGSENQGGDQGMGTNVGMGVVPDLSAIIAQQLQNLLPTILAQVENHVNQPKGSYN